MPDEKKQFEELTIKFGKGLAEDFTGKDGKAYKRILIPNADPADHSPWASFVLPAKAVHENQYGKGLWAKIPAEGHTTVTKPERTDGIDGEIVWAVMSISLWPHGQQPASHLCPWDFPGKNTGVGCHLLLQDLRECSVLTVAPESTSFTHFYLSKQMASAISSRSFLSLTIPV